MGREFGNLERLPNDDKFRELVLFVCARSEGDETFGATKLNKLLFFADFLGFLRFGKAITWHRYQKLEKGPAPRALLPILSQMETAKEIAFSERDYFGWKQKRAMALREPNLDSFSGPEVDLISKIIEHYKNTSARDMSDLSHQFIGWQVAEIGEDIPYDVAHVCVPEPTEQVRRRGQELEPLAKECLSRGKQWPSEQ